RLSRMDIRTLLFADLVVQVCCGAGLLLMSGSVPGLKGLRWFAWAYGAASAGLLLAILQPLLPGHAAILVGRSLLLLGAVLMTQGIAEFVVPTSSVLGWGAGLLLLFAVADSLSALGGRSNELAVAIFGVAFAAQLLVGILVLLADHEPAERAPSRTIAWLLAGVAALSLSRAAVAPLRGIGPNLLANDAFRFGGLVLYLIFSAGMAFGFVWLMTARLRNQLEQQARTDALTGVLNRRALDAEGQRELAACRRRKAPLTLLAIDLDHFKRLNDSFGHGAGDVALAAAARWLAHDLRSTDLLARFGGEEFIAVLPDRDAERGLLVAERLRARLEALEIEHERHRLRLTASFGVAALSGDDDAWGQLLRRADHALYEAKRSGRNCIRLAAAPELEPAPAAAAGMTLSLRGGAATPPA
ncbi:MAG: GGDEF domain-containing protein, partial [Terriglobales bacterium]